MESKKINAVLGLDLGVASVGWALFKEDETGEPCRLIDTGSFVYDQIENPKSGQTENILRRQKRSMRRQRRRKERRLEDGRKLFLDELGVNFDEIDLSKYKFYDSESSKYRNITPFELKIKGLCEKLTKEELCIALYHYLKYRGFKSNRKADSQKADASERKMLAKYNKVDTVLKAENEYISEYIWKDFLLRRDINKGAKIHNSGDEFTFTVTRDMYEKEINALLNKQIEFDVISEDFKNRFLKLFKRQRDFSDGPSEQSKYHIKWGELVKKCVLDKDGNDCAPKDSYSAKEFVLLSSLNNINYKLSDDDKYHALTNEQIKAVIDEGMKKKELKYKDIFKIALGKKSELPYMVKGLTLSRKERRDVFIAFLKKKNITERNHQLSDSENIELSGEYREKMFNKRFFKNSDLVYELVNSDELDDKYKNSDAYDDIARILLVCKTDNKVEQEYKNSDKSDSVFYSLRTKFDRKTVDYIKTLPDCNGTIDLSLEICRKIRPFLLQGDVYSSAMEKAGIKFTGIGKSQNRGKLPDIETILKETGIVLKNPVVKHTLVQVIKVVNAVIDKYGCPTDYRVELARELKRNFEERKDIRNSQLENQSNNIDIKREIFEKYPDKFDNINSINKDDVIRYKLFKEQGELSPYTNEKINESYLFARDKYEIDHIVPYSRSFDDSFNNKVLVETDNNRIKGNKTPFECKYIIPYMYINSAPYKKKCSESILENVKKYISNHRWISSSKKEHLLSPESGQTEFLAKDFEDTAYLSRMAKEIIEYYLVDDPSHVRTISGGITDALRRIWRVSGRTHSYVPGSDFKSLYKSRQTLLYTLNSFNCENNSLLLTFDRPAKQGTIEFEIKQVVPKKGTELSEFNKMNNRSIQYFCEHIGEMKLKFKAGSTIDQLTSVSKSTSDGSNEALDAQVFIWSRALDEIIKDSNKKIRDNDLHHALDACVIACATPKAVKRITDYYQKRERYFDDDVNVNADSLQERVMNAGDNLPEYWGRPIPLPYEDFDKEVLTRIYERDQDTLIRNLNTLPMYKNDPATNQNVHVVWPVRLPKKTSNSEIVKGAISMDTIYGKKPDGCLTSSKSIIGLDKGTWEKLKKTKSIYNPNCGNNGVIASIDAWINDGKKTTYPMLLKKGTPIKSIEVIVSKSSDGKVDLGNNRYAENSDCVRVKIYKKKEGNTDSLYLVPIFNAQIAQEAIRRRQIKFGKTPSKEIQYTIMWAQGENGRDYISSKELEEQYKLVGIINRYSLLEIVLKNGTHGLVYSGGATGGTLEVYSILGDNKDLANAHFIQYDSTERCKLTISTIKEIKVHNISPIGIIS